MKFLINALQLLLSTLLLCSASFAQEFEASNQTIENQLDNLRILIRDNDPAVQSEIEQLDRYFASHPNPGQQSRFLNLQAYSNLLKQEYADSYSKLLESRRLAESAGNLIEIAESHRLEGLILDPSGEHARALEALNISLNLLNQVGSKEVLRVLSAIGNVHMAIRDYEEMLQFSYRYLAAAQRFNDVQNEGVAYFFQGYALTELQEYQDAQISLMLAERILEDIQYPFIGIVYSAIAKLHLAEDNIDEALRHINQSSAADARVGFLFNEGARTMQLAEIYQRQGKPQLAIQELSKGLDKEPVKNDTAVLLQIMKKLIALYEAESDYQSAFNYSKQYKQAFDKSFNERQARLLAINQVKFSVSEKEETIKLLEKENQLQEQRNLIQQQTNTFQLYLIFGALVSLILVIGLWLRTREQRKALDSYAQELQKATEAKSDFLARMSHEIRTPMNAIIGLTRLSQKNAETPELLTNLNQIESASQTLLGVINDILDFSKIEAGKMDIESTPFELDTLVNQVIRFHSVKANEKNIELIQHISRDVPLHLVGDPLRIQQVLSNLLSNALKFTNHGLISVTVRKRHTKLLTMLEFEVKDTGVGLTPEQADSLFQPFNQGDESVSRKFGGTGLGLAICRQLSALMGGEIWVESEPGKGASFFFTVLLEEDKVQPVASPSKQLSMLNVLVADDVSLSRHAIADALLMANIHADLAAGGQEAIGMLRTALQNDKPYDVLVLDWKMPDIDGLQVAAVMNQELMDRRPKVIMLSAYDAPQMREQANQLGIRHFIKKPFATSELINTLQELALDVSPDTSAMQQISTHLPDLTGKHILLAEDNALNQKVALGLLKDTHAKVEVVNNGLQAIEKLSHNDQFDVVLMDIQMPEMDGLTATRYIRDELKLRVPIIAMTAHAMQRDIDKSLTAGMNAHVTKPIDPDDLFQALSKVLDKAGDTLPSSSSALPILNKIAPEKLCYINKKKAMQALLNDESLYNVLLNDFTALKPELDALHTAIQGNDYRQIFRITHIYTTALKYIGAFDLAELSNAVELNTQEKAKALDEDTLSRLLALLYDELVKMHDKVNKLIENIKADPH